MPITTNNTKVTKVIDTTTTTKENKLREKQRVELIREGNAAFNEGNIDMAARIFKATDYKDGLIRVGDYYYFDKHQPLMAYGYYRRANYQKMLDKIFDGFTFALKCWLWDEDSATENSDENSLKEKTPPLPQTKEQATENSIKTEQTTEKIREEIKEEKKQFIPGMP